MALCWADTVVSLLFFLDRKATNVYTARRTMRSSLWAEAWMVNVLVA
jgi:hypothetical protein